MSEMQKEGTEIYYHEEKRKYPRCRVGFVILWNVTFRRESRQNSKLDNAEYLDDGWNGT
jgi:hypothetical protein